MPSNTRAPRDARWISLIVLCSGMLMIVLDATVVNVALPSIQSDFGFSQSALAWVVNAYMIAFGGVLLLAGRLGDLVGSKRVFLCGLVAFTLASLACGLAWNRDVLVVARFVQGLGGAMASSVVLAMIVRMFREPYERAKAMGVFSFTASAGGSIGLLVGGVITQLINWHWIFLINVPIGAIAFVVATRVLADDRGIGLRKGADVLGAVLVTACLMLAVYTVVEIPDQGIGSAHTLGFGAVAALLFVAFLVRQATAVEPLLPLTLFKSRNVSGSNALQVLIVAGMFGFFFLDSLYMRKVLGYDAVAIGLAFLPVNVSIAAFSLGWSARITTRLGPYAVTIAGLTLATAGLAIFSFAPLGSSYVTTLLPGMLLLGVGLGVSFPSIMMFAMSGATSSNSGLASGVVNTTSQVGGAFGLAVLATMATSKIYDATSAGAGTMQALSAGYHLAFAAATICMLLAAAVAVTVLQPRALGASEDESDESAAA
jgi:EmrB/QacA subfamily drug resistance transporter